MTTSKGFKKIIKAKWQPTIRIEPFKTIEKSSYEEKPGTSLIQSFGNYIATGSFDFRVRIYTLTTK